jgi:hypothetical protein
MARFFFPGAFSREGAQRHAVRLGQAQAVILSGETPALRQALLSRPLLR